MKALYLIAPGKTEIREIERPSATPGEVILRVEAVGFCGGDLNAYRGIFPMQRYPMILGHEVGGIIEESGTGVPENLQPGMKATLSPYESCGKCPACRNKRPNACRYNQTMGVMRPGAMTRYISASWKNVYPSERLSTKHLALVEPLSVGFHAVERGRITDRDTVLVLGCGIVGLGVVAGAAAKGAKVIATDIDASKLLLAAKAGAKNTINPKTENLHRDLMSLTSEDGPDVVVEAVGRPETYRVAVEEVAFTGRVVYIGYAKNPVEYETKLFVQKELDILGSRNCLGDFPRIIKILENGAFPVESVISQIVPLTGAGDALAAWDVNPENIIKILVSLED